MTFGGGASGGPLGAIPFGGHVLVAGLDFSVDSVRQIAPNGVAVTFTKSVSAVPAAIAANYALYLNADPAQTWTVVAAHLYPDDTDTVYLELAEPLTFGETFRVDIDPAVVSASGDVLLIAFGVFEAWECLEDAYPSDAGQEPILQALTDSYGRAMAEAAGFHFTRLHWRYDHGDTQAVLWTAFMFPDAGTFIVDGRRYDYTSREPHRFLGVTPQDENDLLLPAPQHVNLDTPLVGHHKAGALTLDWGRDYSFHERARQSAFVSQAQGRMLDRAGVYARPAGHGDDAYRRLELALVYKDRGPWRTLYNVLKGLFWNYRMELPGRVLSGYYVETIPSVAQALAGCYVEMGLASEAASLVPDSNVYHSQGFDIATQRLYMEPAPGSETMGWLFRWGSEVKDVTVWPFEIIERLPATDFEGDGASPILVEIRFVPWAIGSADHGWYLNMPDATEDLLIPEHGYLYPDATEDDPDGDFEGPYIGAPGLTQYVGIATLKLIRAALPAGSRVVITVEE